MKLSLRGHIFSYDGLSYHFIIQGILNHTITSLENLTYFLILDSI